MQAEVFTMRCPHCGAPMEIEPLPGESYVVCCNDSCKQPFQVDIPEPEKEEPAEVHKLAGDDQPSNAESHDPNIEVRAGDREVEEANGKEIELLVARPAMARRFPLRYGAYIGLIGLGAILSISALAFGLSSSMSALGAALLGLGGLGLAGFGAVRMLLWRMRNRGTQVVITSKRAILRKGGATTDTVEVQQKDITNIKVSQNLLGKLANVGDVLVTTAVGEEKKAILLMAMPDPERVASKLRHQP